MTTPHIQLDGTPTPRVRAKRTRRAIVAWLVFCSAAVVMYGLRVAQIAGVL